ncbi:MAG TPA: 16S rRNA (cytidine(1402)-2'-O)-methyltransferase [Terracidiphilus sp.]|jgi:16S rRNA (cytidine1402-2'-O)-methyltransferase
MSDALAPGLYLVATPIGNLGDITLRALEVLKQADRIACEDTRQTQKLLNHFDITTPTVSYHEHNEFSRAPELIGAIKDGKSVAVVSDAGTPGISDPGSVLVRGAIAAGVPVIPIPGANAALSALVASGLPSEHFQFLGFLPEKTGARRSRLEDLAVQDRDSAETIVFYEAPHRIAGTLADLESVFGPALRTAVARELTKIHEEFLRGTVAEVRAQLTSRDRIRGEFVVLIEAPVRKDLSAPGLDSQTWKGSPRPHESIAARVARFQSESGLDEKEALKRLARESGVSKSELYRELQRERARRR